MHTDKIIEAEHQDLIHDVAYDFHGRRMATCSSDQTVKIWDVFDDTWTCTASWKTHTGSVWRVTWAHPEFGQIIATCSFDRTILIWEELPGESKDGKSHWIKRSSLVDSRSSVTDIKFAPRHLGLQLATCSQDGYFRIYEAQDIMSLGSWTKHDDVPGPLPSPTYKLSCSCLSWSTSRAFPPLIAVGYDDHSQPASKVAHVILYEYHESTRKWLKVDALTNVTEPARDLAFAPNLGRSFLTLAVASKCLQIFTMKPIKKDVAKLSFEIKQIANFDDYIPKIWRVTWNVTGTILASSGEDGCVKLWKGDSLLKWKCIATLKGDGASSISKDKLNNSGTSVHFVPPASKSHVPWH